MSDPNFVLLYVKNTAASVEFYTELLGKPPVANFPTFVQFALESGVMLGLWSTESVAPAPTPAGGGELAFAVSGNAQVEAEYERWTAAGVTIAQSPTDMIFGRTFVGVDPDGHRLRVFAPSGV